MFLVINLGGGMFLVINLEGGGFLASSLEVRSWSPASDFSGLEAARIVLVMSATKIFVPLSRLICTELMKWLLFCRAGCLTKTIQGRCLLRSSICLFTVCMSWLQASSPVSRMLEKHTDALE